LNRGVDQHLRGRPRLNDQLARRIEAHDLAVALELPERPGASGEARAQAPVLQEITRMLGGPVDRQIPGRSGSVEALDARANRHGDHVLLQALVVTDSRVAAGREHVHEAILDRQCETEPGSARRRS
jgi:hypothetical protein